MRFLGPMLFVSCLAFGCTSTYHPEYHPVTSTTYSNTVTSPMVVQTATGQPVTVVPAPPPTTVFPAPQPPPTPPPDFPW